MILNNIILGFSFLLLSCSSSKEVGKDSVDFTLISAEETVWYGGIAGVKGTKYQFVLKADDNKKYNFKNFVYGKAIFHLNAEIKKNMYYLTAIRTDEYKELEVGSSSAERIQKTKVENEPMFLEYTVNDDKSLKHFPILKISDNERIIGEEALPN